MALWYYGTTAARAGYLTDASTATPTTPNTPNTSFTSFHFFQLLSTSFNFFQLLSTSFTSFNFFHFPSSPRTETHFTRARVEQHERDARAVQEPTVQQRRSAQQPPERGTGVLGMVQGGAADGGIVQT